MRSSTFYKRTASFFWGSVLISGSLLAGAWTQEKDGGFFKLGSRYVQATQFHDPTGNSVDIPTLKDFTQSLYTEYGLTPRMTLTANIPFLRRITLNKVVFEESMVENFEGDAKTGIADFDIGVKYLLFKAGQTVFSGALTLGIPIGDNEQENGLFTGDGEFNQKISLGVGHSFYPRNLYLSAEAGFNNRTEGYSDEIHYSAEAGVGFGSRWLVILRATGVESLENGDDNLVGGTGGLFANDQFYLAYGPEVVFNINDNLGVSASVESATRVRNVLSAPAFGFGLFLKR